MDDRQQWGYSEFQFPSTGKARVNKSDGEPVRKDGLVSIPFNREGTCKLFHPFLRLFRVLVSIPFNREGTCKLTPFSTQTGRGSKHPKTKHELRRDLFTRKITPKIPQTLVAIEPNAIFYKKWLGTQAGFRFDGNFKRIRA